MYKLKRVTRKTWAGKEKFDLASDKIGPILNSQGHPVTGLTNEEARELEKKMNLPEKHLAPNSSFWDDFYVLLASETRELSEDIPEDELAVKFLMAHKLVANSLEEAKKAPNKLFVIFKDEEVHKSGASSFKLRNKAAEIYNTLDLNDMVNILAVDGNQIKGLNDGTVDTITGLIGALVERDPKKFIAIAEDKALRYKVVVAKGLQYGILKKDKAHIENSIVYFNNEMLGRGMNGCVEYLMKPENAGTLQYVNSALEHAISVASGIVTKEIVEASKPVVSSLEEVIKTRPTRNVGKKPVNLAKEDSSPAETEQTEEFIP